MQDTAPDNRFAPPRANVADLPAADGAAVPATRLARLGAAALDSLACIAIFMAVMLPLYGLAGMKPPSDANAIWPGLILYYVLAYGMEAWFLHRSSQSLGKLALGLRIVRADGRPAGFVRTFWLRLLLPGVLAYVPWVGVPLLFVDCLFIFGPARRCLHDYLAGTIVATAASAPAAPRPAVA